MKHSYENSNSSTLPVLLAIFVPVSPAPSSCINLNVRNNTQFAAREFLPYDIYKDLGVIEALSVVTLNNFCNPSTEIDKNKVIQNDSTQTPAAKKVEIKEKSGKNSETKFDGENKEKEQLNKRKRDEKAKKEEVKKKMVKIKGKKKVEDDDEDFVLEEPHDEEDDNKKCEPEFKSLRTRTTVLPLYDATQSLSPERKSKIREMGFASIFIWDHMKTSKIGWDDKTLQNWEIFEMCQGKFGLVDVIQENEETENESEVEKRKLKEVILGNGFEVMDCTSIRCDRFGYEVAVRRLAQKVRRLVRKVRRLARTPEPIMECFGWTRGAR
ncbi:hypothetical protein Tco_1438863 [Tanacetum coccineum]